ncbi:hypothetical protein [Calothrix sp. 336/3]|uniref:hypothetical protein n=1 Tax=Calothrix sp. 336/3 TaxID=1337936 RepID=UPI0004E39926|nr:hypothetical protein [Calothrix sp. 336/3]AKG19924.1 hypothetical protein IJ00_00060 [Calothrix sp. 336/3]
MKTAEKFAAGWLLILGFMFINLSISSAWEKHNMLKPLPPGSGIDEVVDYTNREALYTLDVNSKYGLVFGVPTFLLGAWLAVGLYRQTQQEKKALKQQMHEHLQMTFYRMIQENHGRVTVLGFAMQSELPAAIAKQYLDEQAKQFNANYKVTEEGGISYHFEV